MRHRSQLILGGFLLFFGLIFLLANLLDLDIWMLCWPVVLILVGVWLLFRPNIVLGGVPLRIRVLGNVKRYGEWQVRDEEIWMFVGDVRLDLTRAQIPPGETRIRVVGFVGDVDLLAPRDVGVGVVSSAFLTDANLWGQKEDAFLTTVNRVSLGFESAERKVWLDTLFFVGDLDVDQV